MSIVVACRDIYRGANRSLCALSRREVADREFTEPYVVISIADPRQAEPVIYPSEHLLGVLRLQFHDIDRVMDGCQAPCREDGEKIVAFIGSQPPGALIVVHCEAGISRSAGVAAGLSFWLNGEDQFFFDHFQPNARARNCVLRAAGLFD